MREFELPADAEFEVTVGRPANPQRFARIGNRLGAHVAARTATSDEFTVELLGGVGAVCGWAAP